MERQELYCHNCQQYVRFDVPEADGRLTIRCPNCGHQHYRVVRNRAITEERWASSSATLPSLYATNVTNATTSFVYRYSTTSTSGSSYLGQSWLDMTSGSS